MAIFAAEALYATYRRLVPRPIGVSVAAYNIMLLAVAVTRYIGDDGAALPAWALTLVAAHATAMSTIAGPLTLASAYALMPPLIAPASFTRWRMNRPLQLLVGGLSIVGMAAIATLLSTASDAVRSYDRYVGTVLRERPEGDLVIGIRLLGAVEVPPPPSALRNDLALVDTTGAGAISVVIDPSGTTPAVLDSLARVFEPLRRDSLILIVTLAYPSYAARLYRAGPIDYEAARIQDLDRIVRRLHPDYLVPADEPYGRGVSALGSLSLDEWKRYLAGAARSIHEIDPHVKVAVAASTFDAPDSALFAWAAAPDSPIDVVGFSLFPGFDGAVTTDERSHAAARWIQNLSQPEKEQWVFSAGGYPSVHGERAQELAVWGALVWASSRSTIKGIIVSDADDYGSITGLRAASGRLRPATLAVTRAVHHLRNDTQ